MLFPRLLVRGSGRGRPCELLKIQLRNLSLLLSRLVLLEDFARRVDSVMSDIVDRSLN